MGNRADACPPYGKRRSSGCWRHDEARSWFRSRAGPRRGRACRHRQAAGAAPRAARAAPVRAAHPPAAGRRHAGAPPPAPARGRARSPACRAPCRPGRSAPRHARGPRRRGPGPSSVDGDLHMPARRRRAQRHRCHRPAVNLMALSSRLATACSSRSRSPTSVEPRRQVGRSVAAHAPRPSPRTSRPRPPARRTGRAARRPRGGRRPRPRRCAAAPGRCG